MSRVQSKICRKYLAVTLIPSPCVSVSFNGSPIPNESSLNNLLCCINSMVAFYDKSADPPCARSFIIVTYVRESWLITHGDGRVHREVVGCYGCVVVSVSVVCKFVIYSNILNSSLLHLKTIWICVKCAFWIKRVEEPPVYSDVFSLSIFDWNRC